MFGQWLPFKHYAQYSCPHRELTFDSHIPECVVLLDTRVIIETCKPKTSLKKAICN